MFVMSAFPPFAIPLPLLLFLGFLLQFQLQCLLLLQLFPFFLIGDIPLCVFRVKFFLAAFLDLDDFFWGEQSLQHFIPNS